MSPGRQRWSTGRPPWVCTVIARAAAAHGTTAEMILTGHQERSVTAARWRAIGELRAAGYSLPTIGRWMRLHHTSVLNALQQMGKAKQPYQSTAPPHNYDEPDESGVWAI